MATLERISASPRFRPHGAQSLPAWAEWTADPSRVCTLGVEDEVMLLDPARWAPAQASDRVIAGLPADLARCVRPETHAAVVELVTGVHDDVAGALGEIRMLRARLSGRLAELGLTAAAAGTHPAARWSETAVSGSPRYRLLQETMRTLVEREPTMALHVHVGVPSAEDALQLLNWIRAVAPLLLALSANSPYSRGADGGFDSLRRVLFQAFPRTGSPRWFPDYGAYVDAVDSVVSTGAIPDPSFLWWDARLQPRLGTVELRIMDAQSEVADIGALVALVQSFAHLVLERGEPAPAIAPEVVEENGFLAARDGIEARLIDPEARKLVPVRAMVEALVEDCRPHAAVLGCGAELEDVARLAAANGAARQRAAVAAGGFDGLVADLAERF